MKDLHFGEHNLKYEVRYDYYLIDSERGTYKTSDYKHTSFFEGEEEIFETKRYGFLWLKKEIVKSTIPKFLFRIEEDIESGNKNAAWWKERIQFKLNLNKGYLI